jgi:hypothetical protein
MGSAVASGGCQSCFGCEPVFGDWRNADMNGPSSRLLGVAVIIFDGNHF